MPLMLAWWFQKREGQLRVPDFLIAGLLLAVPVGLVIKQPDLGTALLILAGGLYVIFFAGLQLAPGAAGAGAGRRRHRRHRAGRADASASPACDWPVLRDYQKHRVCTLLDPTRDPLGKGFHIIQGMIAIGSGGITGKGFMNGTQTHLEFIPERTTDFIFAAFSEEFGLFGVLVLLASFVFLIFRGLMIAAEAPTVFTRLLAGARDAELLHLRLRQHGHGQRHPAGGGRAAALRQLRRHGDGDAGAGARHPDERVAQPAADAELMRCRGGAGRGPRPRGARQ